MMNYALRISDYYKDDRESVKGNISVNQLIVNTIAKKVATLKTLDYLEQRAAKGSREHVLSIFKNTSKNKMGRV